MQGICYVAPVGAATHRLGATAKEAPPTATVLSPYVSQLHSKQIFISVEKFSALIKEASFVACNHRKLVKMQRTDGGVRPQRIHNSYN